MSGVIADPYQENNTNDERTNATRSNAPTLFNISSNNSFMPYTINVYSNNTIEMQIMTLTLHGMENFHLFPETYLSIAAAALRPAPMARITVAAPVTASPPA